MQKIQNMKVLPKIEILIVFCIVSFVTFFTITSGEFADYLVKLNIILPFILIWAALNVLSIGLKGFSKIVNGVQFLLTDALLKYPGDEAINASINASYTSSFLWILYAIIVTPYGSPMESWLGLVSASAASLLYGFVVSEFFLRPMKSKAAFLHSNKSS